MICKITFTVNGQSRELSLETDSASPLTDQDIITVLQNNPEYCAELSEQIKQAVTQTNKKTNVTIKQLQDITGLIGNCDLEYLRNQPAFSEIEFPPVEASILLLDNLNIGKKNIYGRIIPSQGKELFVVRNDEDDVKRLANFLNVRYQIQQLGLNLDENSKWYKPLQEILKKREGIKTLDELIIDFNYNKSAYRDIYVNNNGKQESAINILTNFVRTVRDWSLPTSYDDSFINEVNIQSTQLGEGQKFLSYDRLYNILRTYHKEDILDKFNITSIKSMKEILSKPIKDLGIYFTSRFQVSEGDTDGYSVLLNNLFITEPNFTYNYLRSTDKGVILKSNFNTIETKYGIGYDTISTMDIINPNYRGYKIYKYVREEGADPVYFVSRGYLVENSGSKSFKSLDEAINGVENSLKFQQLSKNSMIEFKFRDNTIDENGNIIFDNSLNTERITSRTPFIDGQIIEVLDIPVKQKTNIIGSEIELVTGTKSTLRDFQTTVDSWNIPTDLKTDIKQKMNTPEKAVTFIYKINEVLKEDRSNEEQIRNVLQQIDEAGVNYYYIEKKSFVSPTKGWSYRIIPTTPDTVTEYKQNKGKPVVTWMQAISEALSKQFGVNVHLMTSSEIKEELSKVANPNTDKAFIYNGEVYVNTTIAKTTDLLHEYIHLVLGVLKSNPDLRQNYEQLMHLIVNTDEGKQLYNDLQETYPDLSQMDIMEEVFAKLFSGYIRNNITISASNVFQSNEDVIVDMSKSIFNTKISDVKKFYGENPITIFAKFNNEVANILQKGNLDFGQDTRIYSNYISKQIKEGNIIEQC